MCSNRHEIDNIRGNLKCNAHVVKIDMADLGPSKQV